MSGVAPVWRRTGPSLNLRVGPGTQFAVKEALPANAALCEIAKIGDWICVVHPRTGRMGWISGKSAPVDKTPWLSIAEEELEAGIVEIAGGKDNPRIVLYHQYTSLRATDDETPWCSAGANYCVFEAGYQGTNDARARSWLAYGQRINNPVRGAICILSRGSDRTQGHVGFVIRADASNVWLLGGNQGNTWSVQRFPISRVLGYRLPFGVSV